MEEQEIVQILEKLGAVITDSHVVYTSGKHGTAYVNKDAVYPDTIQTRKLCLEIARKFVGDNIEVVVAPAVGAIALSQGVANFLTLLTRHKVIATYAERKEDPLIKADKLMGFGLICADAQEQIKASVQTPVGEVASYLLNPGDELIIKRASFTLKRGYEKLVRNKKILVVEDVLTTGTTARKVIEATREYGGDIVALAALCNRGGIVEKDIGDPPRLFALINIKLEAFDEEHCPLCIQGIPINTTVGKGKEYLAYKQKR